METNDTVKIQNVVSNFESRLTRIENTAFEFGNQLNAIDKKIETLFKIVAKPDCHDTKETGVDSGVFFLKPEINDESNIRPHEAKCIFNEDGSTETIIDTTMNEKIYEMPTCNTVGCGQLNISYKASDKQISSLIKNSLKCKQTISYNCNNTPLSIGNEKLAWWKDNNGMYLI